ncbi:MAG: hypothetical protein V1804_00010 [Patescibacteria group bacterium]
MGIEKIDNSLIKPVPPIEPVEKKKIEKKFEKDFEKKKKKKDEDDQIGTNIDIEV